MKKRVTFKKLGPGSFIEIDNRSRGTPGRFSLNQVEEQNQILAETLSPPLLHCDNLHHGESSDSQLPIQIIFLLTIGCIRVRQSAVCTNQVIEWGSDGPRITLTCYVHQCIIIVISFIIFMTVIIFIILIIFKILKMFIVFIIVIHSFQSSQDFNSRHGDRCNI